MSITDELRAWAKEHLSRSSILAIADRIDAEHEKALREAYAKGCEDGMGVANAKDAQAEYLRGKNDGYDEGWDAGFASADDWFAQHEDAMAEHGWVRLPKDADNVPWNPGDRDEDGNVVTHLMLTSDGWYAITDGIFSYHPERRRHYHAPTVEDVLTEFGIDWEHVSDCEDRAALLKEYAAKLRLAEEDA